MKFRIAKPSDSRELARLYMECFSRTSEAFLPQLGFMFVAEYHKILLDEANSIVICAENSEGRIIGFACGTLNASEHLRILQKYKLRLALASIPGLIRKPSLMLKAITRMKAPSASSKDADHSAFIVTSGCRLESWGCLSEYRAGGTAIRILQNWLSFSKQLGAVEVCLEVDEEMLSKTHRIMGARLVKAITTPDGRKRKIMKYIFSSTQQTGTSLLLSTKKAGESETLTQ